MGNPYKILLSILLSILIKLHGKSHAKSGDSMAMPQPLGAAAYYPLSRLGPRPEPSLQTLWYIFFVWDHEKKQFNSKKVITHKKTTILYVFIKYESQWAVISLFILLNRAIEWRVDLPNSWEATKREAPETEPLAELCLMEFLLEHIGHPSPMDLCSHRKGSWPAVWV